MFEKRDKSTVKVQKALNSLELFLNDVKEFFSSSQVNVVMTASEKNSFYNKTFKETKEWFEENKNKYLQVGAKLFAKKLNEMKEKLEPVYKRIYEMKNFPEAMEKSRKVVEFAGSVYNETLWQKRWMEEKVLGEFKVKLKEFVEYIQGQIKMEARWKKSEDPLFSSDEISKKAEEMNKLAQKINTMEKPKRKKAPRSEIDGRKLAERRKRIKRRKEMRRRRNELGSVWHKLFGPDRGEPFEFDPSEAAQGNK